MTKQCCIITITVHDTTEYQFKELADYLTGYMEEWGIQNNNKMSEVSGFGIPTEGCSGHEFN